MKDEGPAKEASTIDVSMEQSQTHPRRRFAIGIVCACIGALCWGLSGSCAQFLFEQYGIGVANLTFVRNLVAGILFALSIAVSRRREFSEMMAKKSNVALVVAYGAALFLTQIFYMSAVSVTNAGTATVLQMLYMVIIIVIVSFKDKRLPSWQSILGFVFAMVGTVLIATQGDVLSINMPLEGLVLGLITAVCAAGYILIPKGLIEKYGSLTATGAAMVVDALLSVAFWVVFSNATGETLMFLDLTGLLMVVIGVGFFGTFAAFLLYMYGVGVVGSVTGGLLGAVEPVGAMVTSALWLGTAFTGWDWAGMALMLGMLVCVTIPTKKRA